MNDYIARTDSNIKEVRESEADKAAKVSGSPNKGSLETEGPQKKQFNVLNEDGSLADLLDQDVEGAGSGDGTIGAH